MFREIIVQVSENDDGVPLLVGTDCNVTGLVPGFCDERRIGGPVGAGLTRYQALHATTANAASFLGLADRAGCKQLEDITNVSRRTGVMLHGRWFSEDEAVAMNRSKTGTSGFKRSRASFASALA